MEGWMVGGRGDGWMEGWLRDGGMMEGGGMDGGMDEWRREIKELSELKPPALVSFGQLLLSSVSFLLPSEKKA